MEISSISRNRPNINYSILTNYGQKLNPGKELSVTFLGEINKYSKNKRIRLIKRTSWILPHTVQETSTSGAPTFYNDGNNQEKTGYKSENLIKALMILSKSQNYMLFLWYY